MKPDAPEPIVFQDYWFGLAIITATILLVGGAMLLAYFWSTT